MMVATYVAQWENIDWSSFLAVSVGLLGFEEIMYLALFLWLAIHGAGRVSIDYLLEKPSRDTINAMPRGAVAAVD
jgi:uncharacterized membrane protein YphA (DoxX/SURF4 family)